MLNILFWVGVGLIIGWQIPEPFWVKLLFQKVLDLVKQKVFGFKK